MCDGITAIALAVLAGRIAPLDPRENWSGFLWVAVHYRVRELSRVYGGQA
jgi:hypothetical protein